jgi:hypothetical protein
MNVGSDSLATTGFWMADICQRELEGNRTGGRNKESSSANTPAIQRTSFHGLCITADIHVLLIYF